MSLIIVDEEFERGAKRIKDMSDEILNIFVCYSKAIQTLTMEGICDVAVNNVLSEKLEILDTYAKTLADISSSIVNHTNEFIDDIDEADSFLYD